MNTNGDHDFGETVETLTPLRAQATGIMHIQVDNIGPAPEVLGKHWSGPKLAYSETGRWVLPERLYEEVSSPQDYAAEVADWIKNYEIQIVGGGCGTDPERTRTLKNLITNLAE